VQHDAGERLGGNFKIEIIAGTQEDVGQIVPGAGQLDVVYHAVLVPHDKAFERRAARCDCGNSRQKFGVQHHHDGAGIVQYVA